eukprot:gnl/TRDRNA2_/TRDRNA2_169933_c1_seq2.p1 gnl/TRDRNA2_/TRDRNA2_169933_c1~~gnl/TRDRNA2_/TRDRNA2_169933_c1_seq2.p1  ORF type:complete len:537 (+),score=94.01 gnl/TRDRNA2_/TRDRNA2_169933_c1_seq2:751-2361(+)
MFADKTYVVFTFERLCDVRIVYVPPFSLGNFGGDTDNFEWPRHSADFTLLRAYVGPNGESAQPSPDNVPYRPAKYLRASQKGVSEGDFTFLLGFPGFTMRYAPSCRLAYADEVAIPGLVRDFGRKLDLIRDYSADRSIALKLVSAKKSLANEHKRSVGKRVMSKKLGLIRDRRTEEEALVAAVPEAKPLLEKLAKVYDSLRVAEPQTSALESLRGLFSGSALLHVGHTLHEALSEAGRPDEVREEAYRERNRAFLVKRLTKRLTDMHEPHEAALVADAVGKAMDAGFTAPAELLGGNEGATGYQSALEAVTASSVRTCTPEQLEAILGGAEIDGIAEDTFVRVAGAVYADYVTSRDREKALLSERDELLARLLEIQKRESGEGQSFYPDANGTLRLSAGHVEGYQAADAVQLTPITTLAGLISKHDEARINNEADPGEFACPQRLVDLCRDSPAVMETPVNCIYSTDTVGGNSGSPVLNADGEFVAINFDRQRLGLMNEYKWSSRYSRSIGVDVRYILWLIGTYDSAKHLVEEMTA